MCVFYICLFDVRRLRIDTKKIETWRSISELYVEVYVLINVHLLVRSIQIC
jgi:hypothetical protein